MTNRWMLGTAMAAMLAASPALAQQSDFGACAVDAMNNEEFLGYDLNDDRGLSMDELQACLDEEGITLGADEMTAYEARFSEADGDGDGILMFAEVDHAAGTDTADAGTDAPKGTITVTQPAATVEVTQPAADVTVTEAEPVVNVEQKQPEVSVTEAKPEVSVTQAEPTVSVDQPAPEVAVSQPEPSVSVTQSQPEVAVKEGTPAVAVDTPQPEVAVDTPEPEVEVTEPELDVAVEQAEPNVEVAQETADVAVQTTTEPEVDTAAARANQMGTESQAVDASSIEADAAAMKTTTYQINVAELEGADVMNAAGEEIGEVEAVLLDPATDAPVVILSVGGVLGIGDKEIAFPYSDLTITGDEIVLNTDMTEDEIEEMPEYDEAAYEELPETMIVQ